MSKKTYLFLISEFFLIFGFFVFKFNVQAAPTLEGSLTISTSSSIIFQRSPSSRSLTGDSYGGNASSSDYSTSAGTAANAISAGSAVTVDTYHLNQAVTIGANPTFGAVYADNWFRSSGATGWTNDTYAGGWYMSDASWIRTQNSKSVWTSTGLLGTDGGVTSGYGGTTPPSGGAIFSGNIGLGTTNPGSKLDVRGETRIGDGSSYSKVDTDGDLSLVGTADYLVDANRYAFRYSASENYGLYFDLANLEYAFRTTDASKVFSTNINTGNTYIKGNVGIGTTNPTSILSLNGTTSRTVQMERNTTPATAGQDLIISSGGAIAGTADLAGGDLILKSGVSTGSGSSAIRFYATTAGGSGTTDRTPTEKITILGSGNVGIGTTNPAASLEVAGTGIRLGGLTRTTWPSGSASGFGVDAGTYAYYTGGNVGIGLTNPGRKLDVNGNIRAVAFIYSSDINLKKNITTIDSPLQKILELRGVSFNWKKDNSSSLGLIAQEVEKVFPELVSGQEGNKAVAYGNLVAPLIESIKERQKKIDQLKARITILEMER